MNEDIQRLLVDWGAAGMVILVVGMFLNYLKQRNTKMETALEKVAKNIANAETVLVRIYEQVRK